jgi:hypothetical protein
MVSELPAPKSEWSKAEQADWLEALATMFRVIFPEIPLSLGRGELRARTARGSNRD